MEMTGDLTNSMPHRRSPSPLFSPPVLIILVPIIALILLFFAIPPFLSITTQLFRPNGVKKSWDSLIVFLVLFAILCGIFARRNDDDDDNNNNNNNSIRNDSNNNKTSHPVSQQWFDQYPERKIYDDPQINAMPSATSVKRLKRSSSSYPDLRQDSFWENTEDRFRFFDDFEINKYRSSTHNYNDQVRELRRSQRSEFEESEPKVIPVDTFVLRSSPSSPPSKSPAPSTPPPPPPPPPAARHKPRRTYEAVGQKEMMMNQNDRVEFNKSNSPQPVTPPPPPPPPPRRPPSPPVQMGNRSEQRYAKSERRKSNATKEIKMVFASFRKRKKKQKTKEHDHQDDYPLHSPREPLPYYSTIIPPPPPPPPLPPPPSSVFQKYNIFRKGSKSKKIHSVPAPPPAPPPPTFSVSKRSSKQNTQIPPTPPPAFFSTKILSKQKSQIPPPSKPPPAPPTPPPEPSRRRTTAKSGRPPLPTKANTSSYYNENVNSGGKSPLIPMPPSPPPPEFKFMFRGDFVKIGSSPSSRCSSPDLEEVDVSSSKDVETVSMMDGDDGAGFEVGGVPVFCPSPDVNAKAETFIARLKDGWKLEKINSMKEKQRI
ncbi:hypothetical protein CRYUN_Cryun33cG0069000 [Craigia yunnanensis]